VTIYKGGQETDLTRHNNGEITINLEEADGIARTVNRIEIFVSTWINLSVVLNSLNRSVGLPDLYPAIQNKIN